ncbi:hypothetical protein AAMO2058_001366500 [Amorphochlora amoebiformis]
MLWVLIRLALCEGQQLWGDYSYESSDNDDPTGVVHMMMVPPSMGVHDIRDRLTRRGKIRRIYMLPKNFLPSRKRQHAKKYAQGWIEFADKKAARQTVHMLDGHEIGGRCRVKYRDYMWHLTYLEGFKWENLTRWLNSKVVEHKKKVEEWKQTRKQQIRERRREIKKEKRTKRRLERERDKLKSNQTSSLLSQHKPNQGRTQDFVVIEVD